MIRDGKNFGSGLNITDPQHWYLPHGRRLRRRPCWPAPTAPIGPLAASTSRSMWRACTGAARATSAPSAMPRSDTRAACASTNTPLIWAPSMPALSVIRWKQCFGSALLSMRIWIQHFRSMRIRNWKKFTAEIKICIFLWNIAIWLSLDLYKGRPRYSRSLHPRVADHKRTYSTSKHEISSRFLLLWVFFALLYPADQNQCGSGSETLGRERKYNSIEGSLKNLCGLKVIC